MQYLKPSSLPCFECLYNLLLQPLTLSVLDEEEELGAEYLIKCCVCDKPDGAHPHQEPARRPWLS